MQKSIFFTVSLVQYAVELSSDPNRLYKQICNVALLSQVVVLLLLLLSVKMLECVPLQTSHVITKLPARTVL